MKRILLLIQLLVLLSCSSKPEIEYNTDYCFNDGYNTLKLNFVLKSDTVYIKYLNIIDDGNYINGYADEADYAGYFLLKDINENNITFKIGNYRYEDVFYNLSLYFDNKQNEIIWSIPDSEYVSYLPNKASLKKCNIE